jgi:hypothetical protein
VTKSRSHPCVATSYSAWSYNPGFHGVSTLELPAGVHQVLFKFEKYDPHRVNRNERAIIYNIAVVGTTTGAHTPSLLFATTVTTVL